MKKTTVTLMVGLIALLAGACRSVPAPWLAKPTNRNAAWQQDLKYLRDTFPKYNNSFTPDSLKEFTRITDETLSAVYTLSDNEIHVNILRAIATAGDGHTSVNFLPSAGKMRRFPLRFYWFRDGLYVIKTAPELKHLLGAKVDLIAWVDPEELVVKMKDLIAGNESAVRYESIYYLSSPDFLHGLGVVSDPERVWMSFSYADGTTTSTELSPEEMGEKVFGYNSWRELSPLSTESQDAPNMAHVLGGVELPPYIANPNSSCSFEYLAESQNLYVQINQNTNLNSNMSDFADEVKAAFAEETIKSVIVDLRFNTGGNLLLTTDLVKGIPEWHTGSGDIYIIIGGPTFSAGIVTAARLKYYAGDRAVVVGEPAAEGLKFWAETRFFTLPNSQIRIFAAYRYHNWEDTEYERDKKYFWLMKQVGVPAGDLDVDLPDGLSFGDYLAGRDTVVELILLVDKHGGIR